MSAAVCGSKRSHWEENSPTSSKKLRCTSSSSPIRFSPPPSPTTLIDQLRTHFPDMEPQLLERALEDCNNDLDSAIKSLHQLRIGSVVENLTVKEQNTDAEGGSASTDGNAASSDLPSAPNSLPASGAEWVELFVSEMRSATSMDDVRARVTKVLEYLENSICSRAANEVAESYQKEMMTLKEQIEMLIRDNTILKRAVAIQHERQKEYDDKNREFEHVKQLLSQHQEQLRVLEVNNYALKMHLKQAQQSSAIAGRFHPDVF